MESNGVVGSDPGVVTPQQVDSSTQPAEPSIIDIPDDNVLVRIKGSDKPVKFGEYSRGFQSTATRAAQKAAQLERELAAERQTRAQYERERQAWQQNQGQQAQPDVYAQLRQLPYLTGEDAVNVVQNIGQQLQQRDAILLATLRQLQMLSDTVNGLNSTNQDQLFDAKINRFISEGGYPAEAAELAKEIYLAYEGDNLDEEFPQIFASRWEQITRAIDAAKAAKLSAARQTPFVPGKGGRANPSKPFQIDPKLRASETADLLWNALQQGETGT